ncbi:MAG: acyltransferase [Clostridiales bacterium]|nr:acyltransferase [Clostridiales bacterium]
MGNSRGRRLDYIDNLRWILVFLLILYHVCMAYNTWGEANYIFFDRSKIAGAVVTFISPWFMPAMFLLAGVSSRYSMNRRGIKVFMRERLLRLGVPLIFGIAVLNPVLSYVADVTHNGYDGGYLAHYKVFFTKFTDLSGYDGGFALAHLWFIVVLLVISFISCGVIGVIDRMSADTKEALRPVGRILMTIAACASFDIKIMGKPLILYLFIFLIGYYLFSDQGFIAGLSKFKWIFVPVFIVSSAADAVLFNYIGGHALLNKILALLSFISGVLALVSFGHDHLNKSCGLTRFCAKISYTFYIIHFPVVVLCQYLLSQTHMASRVNLVLSILISYPLTLALCFVISKMRGAGILVGMKNR